MSTKLTTKAIRKAPKRISDDGKLKLVVIPCDKCGRDFEEVFDLAMIDAILGFAALCIWCDPKADR